jgi:hypothetical protein
LPFAQPAGRLPGRPRHTQIRRPGGRRKSRARRPNSNRSTIAARPRRTPIPIDNGVEPLLYRLWGLQPLQSQILKRGELILEVWARPAAACARR